MQQAVMYVVDMAKYLGMSETAIRAHLTRKNYNAVPKPIYLGKRIAWRKQDVDEWLKQKSNINKYNEKGVIGRPKKTKK